MKHWIRVAIAIGAIALVAGVGVAAFAVSGGTDPSSIPTVSGSSEPPASPSDDPTPEATRTATASPSASPAEDISGNCDEAEHANDPACQGDNAETDDNPGTDEDNSGPGDDSGPSEDDGSSGHGGNGPGIAR